MSHQQWEVLYSVQGELQAEILRGLLEAQGITVQLSQEGMSRVYGFGVGPSAEVDLLVPGDQLKVAHEVLERYHAGEFEDAAAPVDPED